MPEQEHNRVPLQIAPEPDELPPSPLYIKTGKTWTMIPVRENTPSPKVQVPVGGNVVVAIQKESTGPDGKKSESYNSMAEFPIGEKQDGMLILIIKDPRQPLKWNIYRSLAIDTSWKILPAGSFSVFNACGLPIRGQVSQDAMASVPAFQKVSLQAKADQSRVVPYFFEVQHPNGTWNSIINTSTTLSEGSRIILVPYGVVLPETGRLANLVVIRDFQTEGALETPKAPAGPEAPATAAGTNP